MMTPESETPLIRPAESSETPDFTPVPRRIFRVDGWTEDKQVTFIETLASTGVVSFAAACVGMTVSSAYRLRAHPDAEDFRRAWKAALAQATVRLADIAYERAIEGVAEPIVWKGEIIGERRRYSDRLLCYLLKHNDPLTYGVLSGVNEFPQTDVRERQASRLGTFLGRLLSPVRGKKAGE
jgi:hypothetical protein